MDADTREIVRRRADNRCEYCGLHEDQSPLASLHVEHIRPKKHGGDDNLDNLALACIDCILHKGSNIAGFDPESDVLTELYNPRLHVWAEHFDRRDILIVGKTPIGRTTVRVLEMNSEEQLQLRMVTRG
jgi:predicted restriction endonuclease